MSDLISRQDAIDKIESHIRTVDELYPLTDTDNILNYAFEIAASCVYNLPSAQRWIPVSERLPKDDEEVIISCTDDSGDTPFSYTTVAWHFKGTWLCKDDRCFFITAWMPLPEPYKEG